MRGGAVDIHSLRVTFATLSIGNGANPKDVQQILGHSKIDRTMGIYICSTTGGRSEAINKLPFASQPVTLLKLHRDENDTDGTHKCDTLVDGDDVTCNSKAS